MPCGWWRGFGVGVAVAAALVLALVLTCGGVLVTHVVRHVPDLVHAPTRPLADVTWANGDIILTQNFAYGLAHVPVAGNVPIHVGLVWLHPLHGAVVVDTHHVTCDGDAHLVDVRDGARHLSGVRIVRVADFLRDYRGAVWRRPVVRGTVDGGALAAAVAAHEHVPFDLLVSKGQPLVLAGIALANIMPRAAEALAAAGGPMYTRSGARLRGVYCTELAARLLQQAGAMDAAYASHLCSPLALTSGVGAFDAAAARVGAVAWGKEERLVL